ncbi:hypothetical protein M407DRAFT_30413 [Tulasnella calospora MUT 4182]|uniref:Uncharacterized protein n=1 Tax=Tulasnella calospora MUT 4182 TaxID=1051891 RepID=A0A0C3LEQ6_9AGAM|nr:hypothetical protein M407DRAFT_30413 [Tulasnella calospora MUT 4182]
MLSKLFRTRQSTASRVPPSQSGPTSDQPTELKAPSKLVSKLKKLKNVLRPSRLNRKADDEAGQKSGRSHKSNPSDESWGNLAPGPFTAEDYEFRRGSPMLTPEDLEPSLGSIEWLSGSDARSSRSSSPKSDFATSPPSTRLAPVVTTHVNASVHPQQPVSPTQVESKVLALRKVRRDNAQEVPFLRSSHALTPISRPAPITQNYTPDVATSQIVEEDLLQGAPVHAKTGKKQVEKQSKWWEMGGSLKNHKRHFRRDAVDYGNPNSDHRNVEEFGEKVCSLKRGGANQRRQRPEQRHSSKQAHGPKKASENEPVPGQEKVEHAPFSTTKDAFKCHGRTLSLTSTGTAQAPPSAARQPLCSLNLNVVLSGEAQASLEAGGVEDASSEHGYIPSQGTGVQDATAEASSWSGGIVFPRRQSQGPAQH